MTALLGSEWIKTLLTASFGWLLGTLSQYLLARRARREAISCTLSDLLEIRHQLLAVDKALDEIRTVLPMPPEMETHFRVLLDQHVLPDSKELSKRYDESVTRISAVDPILGYRLRSKNLIGPFLQRLNALMIQDPRAAPFGRKMSRMLLPRVELALIDAIKSLSWKRGPITRWRTGKLLRAPQFPKEASELVDLIRKEVANQQSAGKPGEAAGP
ncbi:MAG: hypothetical protein ACRD3L_10175 [Terriglobales bacterium]